MRNGDTIVMTQRRSSRWLRVDQIVDVRHKRDRGLNPLSSTRKSAQIDVISYATG